MLTDKEISQKAQDYEPRMDIGGTIARSRFYHGAKWANEQNAAEIARLEAERAELLEFVQNLGSPKRGSAEEAWDYFEASQLARALARKYGKK